MADDDQETPDTYQPRRTRSLTVTQEAPHGVERELRYEIKAGTTYKVISVEDAAEILGQAPVNNVKRLIREDCIPSR